MSFQASSVPLVLTEDPKLNVEHVEYASPNSNRKQIKTKAMVVNGPGADFVLQDIVLDEVREDEVLVEMYYSGICHTDLVFQSGALPFVQYPAIFGHEGAGVVRHVGSSGSTHDPNSHHLEVGDYVLLSYRTCNECKQCKAGHPAYCPRFNECTSGNIRISDGSTAAKLVSSGQSVQSHFFGQSSMSAMSVVDVNCCVKVPPGLEKHLGIYSPLGCGFQTGAATVLNALKPEPDESIVVFGLGGVGLSAIMAAASVKVGAIIGVDIVDAKLELAKEFGATHTINNKTGNLVEELKIVPAGVNYALDCTGVIPVIEAMIQSLAPGGTAVQIGIPPPGKTINVDPLDMLSFNKRYMGLLEGDALPSEFIPRMIDMHQKGHFPIERLCKVYPTEKLSEALEDMHSGKTIKPVIEWRKVTM